MASERVGASACETAHFSTSPASAGRRSVRKARPAAVGRARKTAKAVSRSSKKLRRRARNIVSRRRLLLALKSPAIRGLAGPMQSRCELVHISWQFLNGARGFGPASLLHVIQKEHRAINHCRKAYPRCNQQIKPHALSPSFAIDSRVGLEILSANCPGDGGR